ncbi:major fimbrial protein StkA [Serratia fonticola]|uniref:fimbrial protein n=1 Tax=Serratia fonticola TaxID=47917 RepID=UPI002179B974|nr:fimbrial protein [Serratia fonticola]CAI1731874.1 major fimbrial protein StkA [Serratia fonticola]
MKKQNVNITLLASLVMGFLTLSQGAMAGTKSSTVDFRAVVKPTSCNVSAGNTPGTAVNVAFGTITKSEFGTGDDKTVGTTQYNLLPSKLPSVMLEVSGCKGAELAASGTMGLTAIGSGATGAADDLYGDSSTDQGFGFALGYTLTDNSVDDNGGKTNNGATLPPATGFITPANNTLALYEATAPATADMLSDIKFNVEIKPQVGSWGNSQQTVSLVTPVTFNVAMN